VVLNDRGRSDITRLPLQATAIGKPQGLRLHKWYSGMVRAWLWVGLCPTMQEHVLKRTLSGNRLLRAALPQTERPHPVGVTATPASGGVTTRGADDRAGVRSRLAR